MSEENQGSGETKKPNNNRNRNRNRNRNKNRNKNRANSGSEQTSDNKAPNSNNRSKKKRPNNNNRPKRRYKLSKDESIYIKYLTLMEHHLTARKKYFALFDRADPNQKAKLERNFTGSMAKVREFETALSDEDLARFKAKVDGLKFDSTYSDNHEIAFDAEPVSFELDPAEPHYLETQKSGNFSDDTEESSGSLEDYQAYKGV